MSNELTQFKGLTGFDYCNQALSFEKEISVQFLRLGEYLYTIKNNNLFEPQWTSFNEYCDEFQSLSQASISKLLNIYSTFIVEYQFPKERIAQVGGWSNLAEVLPLVHTKEDADEWILKAETLSRVDLRKEITEHKTGLDMRDCPHDNYYTVKVCRTCHDRLKIADSNHD